MHNMYIHISEMYEMSQGMNSHDVYIWNEERQREEDRYIYIYIQQGRIQEFKKKGCET